MLEKAQEIKHHLVAWRRDFHQYPELSFQEFRTAAKIADILAALGYRVRSGVGRTGVVAEIGAGKPVIAIRADMDALPIHENSGVTFASLNPGVMHACGHDSHTAMALGAATLLAGEKFSGTVRFLFQPAEEDNDEEGFSGAQRMIQDGAIDGVEAIIALHIDPHSPVGYVVINDGSASAGVDSFFITIRSNGGHGAFPHTTVDPIFITGHVILAINGIVSRKINPFDPAVVSIGSIHAGQATNVIPSQVELSGTLRYMSIPVQELIHKEIDKALQIAHVLGGEYELRIEKGYPPSFNKAHIVQFLRHVAEEVVGRDKILPPSQSMGAEDFGYFMQHVPGAMFFLGVKGDTEHRLHSPTFILEEDSLPVGTAMFAEAALRFLRQGVD